MPVCGRCHVPPSVLSGQPRAPRSIPSQPPRIGLRPECGLACAGACGGPDSRVWLGKNFSAARVIPAQRDVFAEAGTACPGPETGRYLPLTGAGFKGLWRRVCEKQTAQNSRKSLKEMEKTSGVVFS